MKKDRPKYIQRKHKALPWQYPKSTLEDPEAPGRIEAILKNPSFKQADQDIEFLNDDDTRGVRLQIDYQKAESLLKQHEINNTIVVFGSTRIAEPVAAKQRVERLGIALQEYPDNTELQESLAVAERILAKSHYYETAQEFGALVSKYGHEHYDGQLTIMTGGGPGIMEAANRGAFSKQQKSVGLNIKLPHEQFPNPYITPGLCFSFHYFAIRKLHFLLRTRALVAFPGGYGTFDELFETLTLLQTGTINAVPVVLVGEEYWQKAINLDFMVREGVIDEEDRDLITYAETAQQAWDSIVQWYELHSAPLCPDI